MDSKAKSAFPQVGQQRHHSSKGIEHTSATPRHQGTNPGTSDSGRITHGSILQAPQVTSLSDSTYATGKGGGALKPIDGKFEVNPADGSFSLSIPLAISQARKDFQPSLNLSYASSAGNGPFGIGWHLSLETITRKTSKRVPRYDDSDVFVLSNVEDLVLVRGAAEHLVDGYVVQSFRPRTDNDTLRIERWTSQQDHGNVHWRSISGSNVTKVYGRDDNSRIVDSGAPDSSVKRIFTWLLCESYDPYGNAIAFSYKPENDQGIDQLPVQSQVCELTRDTTALKRLKYIKSIKYGNRHPARDLHSWELIPSMEKLEWLFELVFDYGEHDLNLPSSAGEVPWKVRRDMYSTYSSGFELRSYRLCRRALMFHHIPDPSLGKAKDYLITSTTFDYDEAPTGSHLQSITQNGHIWSSKGRYDTQSSAPREFLYKTPPDLSTIQVKTTKPRNLQSLFVQTPEAKAQWVDLDGDGAAGILVQYNGAWYYQRNEKAMHEALEDDDSAIDIVDDFGAIKILTLQPSCHDHTTTSLEDLDGNGCQDLVIADEEGRLVGYHERVGGRSHWTEFRAFPSVLNLPNADSNVRMLDLTGNGLVDILKPSYETGEMIWYESLGKSGFSVEKRAPCIGALPRFYDHDLRQVTRIADMTGDGLSDIISIANGRVSYWPALGYARFGKEIIMNNSPHFESDEIFDINRVLLLDVDGSGTTDLIYLPSSGGAMLYRNYCGNGWSEGVSIPCFPKMDTLSSVFALDLLGKGTSCLCWLGFEDDGTSDVVIRYIDLACGTKPHLLRSFSSGGGLETSISYSPSTSFFLRDEREGRPWRTRLPFPVHVVRKVVKSDLIAQVTQSIKYAYHDGYFDGREREFRGFGMVEQYENESFPLPNGNTYRKPTCHRKSWFHNGSPELGLTLPGIYEGSKLNTKFPKETSVCCAQEAFRALKCMLLRTEVYEQDSGGQTATPLSVDEMSYEVTISQKPRHSNDLAISKVYTRELLTTHLDRNAEDRRVSHELFLERNEFGDVTQSLSAHYGREKSKLNDAESRELQKLDDFKYTATAYTNALGHTNDVYQPYFYKPLVAEIQESHLQGITFQGMLDLETLVKEDFSKYPIQDSFIANVNVKTPMARVPGKSSRVLFRSQNMTQVLEPRLIEPFSVIDQTFELVMSSALRLQLYGPDDETYQGRSCRQLREEGGFVMDSNGDIWAPSSRSYFGASTNKASQLLAARGSFFSPTITIDPFENQSVVEMDVFCLLAHKWTNPVGDETKSINDYRALTATTMIDANLNQTQVLVDGLGNKTAVARMGKESENIGDSLDGLSAMIEPRILLNFLSNPTKSAASQLLGGAGSRLLNCPKRLTLPSSALPLPPFSISLTRTQHIKAEGKTESTSDISVMVTYYDGRLHEIQTASLRDWEIHEQRWKLSGLAVFAADKNGLQSCHPFFSAEGTFVPYHSVKTPRMMTFIDGFDRPVACLNPDRTWSKICYTPWSRHEFDIGDTILARSPVDDPDVGYYFSYLNKELYPQSWYEHHTSGSKLEAEAAKKSAAYANSPTILHFDACEREIVRIRKSGPQERMQTFRYDFNGNKVLEIDSLGRTIQQNTFDLSGHRICVQTLDSGVQTFFYDCTAQIVLSYENSGISKRYVYDQLRRTVETWVQERGGSECLWSKRIYGVKLRDVTAEAEVVSKNQKGRIICQYDQSGLQTNESFDFKGNCLVSTIRFAAEYRSIFNCTLDMKLEDGTFKSAGYFDALDRQYKSTDAFGRTTLRKYDLLGRLTKVMTSVDGATCASHVTSIEYAADGNATRIKYGNGSQSAYTYADDTRDLLNKRTWREDGKLLEHLAYT